jgi:hypothetical protein
VLVWRRVVVNAQDVVALFAKLVVVGGHPPTSSAGGAATWPHAEFGRRWSR